jgi:ribosomal subunit interface protein
VQVRITERHCQVPRDTLERAEKRLGALSKYSPRASSADVIFTEEKVNRGVEVIIHVDGGEPVVASVQDTEFRAALDKVVDRLARRLRKQREKRTNHQAPSRRDLVGGE